eukprot:6175472-Pleurochrysis_carterae.AAC.6
MRVVLTRDACTAIVSREIVRAISRQVAACTGLTSGAQCTRSTGPTRVAAGAEALRGACIICPDEDVALIAHANWPRVAERRQSTCSRRAIGTDRPAARTAVVPSPDAFKTKRLSARFNNCGYDLCQASFSCI